MSHHAKDLGYDGIILFLDDSSWLASRAADAAWIRPRGQKVTKLVEVGNTDRPIPIINFMARQRDLRELVGETHAGRPNSCRSRTHCSGGRRVSTR